MEDGMNAANLAARLETVTRGMTLDEIADVTGCTPESTRHYMDDGDPPFAFCAKLCEHLELDANWLMNGASEASGMNRDTTANAERWPRIWPSIKDATLSELLAEFAARAEIAFDRLSQIESRLNRCERSLGKQSVEPKPLDPQRLDRVRFGSTLKDRTAPRFD